MKAKNLTFEDFGLESDPFPFISGPIQFGGKASGKPLEFAYYDSEAQILGQPMSKHLPMACAYWHTMRGAGTDMFGPGTMVRPWEGQDTVVNAKTRMRVNFFFMYLVGLRYWCFHDTDIVPYGKKLAEFHANIDMMVPLILELQALTGIKCGWVTQNCFSNPMYCQGAATAADPRVWAHAWAQTKKMIEVGKVLGALNHVFWGGREGYTNLLATDLKLEKDNLGRFLQMAVAYAKSNGYTAQFLIEPKPMEPTTYQYDASAAVVQGFLAEYELIGDFKLNIEVNHAQLAGLTIGHELAVAGMAGLLGGIDANQGTFGNGWDTDEFLTDPMIATSLMLPVLESGGIGCGVINWDAKVRRESFLPIDLFYAHIAGMDTLAMGLRAAAHLVNEGSLLALRRERYEGWDRTDLGRGILCGLMTPEKIAAAAYENEPAPENMRSGNLECYNAVLNRALGVALSDAP